MIIKLIMLRNLNRYRKHVHHVTATLRKIELIIPAQTKDLAMSTNT